MKHAFIEIDDQSGKTRRLWRAPAFAAAHPQLAGSYRALRKRIEQRRTNGLLNIGAVRETRFGVLIDPEQYQAWVLQPRQRAEAA